MPKSRERDEKWPRALLLALLADGRKLLRASEQASFLPLILNEISLPRTTTPSPPPQENDVTDRPTDRENDHGQKRRMDGWMEGRTSASDGHRWKIRGTLRRKPSRASERDEREREREREHLSLSLSLSLSVCVKAVKCSFGGGGGGHNGFCRHNLFTALCRAMREFYRREEERGERREER